MRLLSAATAIALIGFTGVATAADLIVDEPMAQPGYVDWSGFYAGINGGYGLSDATSVIGPLNPAGAIAGVQAGFNYDADKFLVGVEGDLQWSGVKGSHAGAIATGTASLDYFGTLRLRGGIPIEGRTLPYITAGLSYGQLSGTSTFGGGYTTSTGALGFAGGVGAEFLLTDALTLKAEYLYVDYGDVTFFSGTPIEEKIRSRMGALRVGLNYKF